MLSAVNKSLDSRRRNIVKAVTVDTAVVGGDPSSDKGKN
jgi:hypothetical protein